MRALHENCAGAATAPAAAIAALHAAALTAGENQGKQPLAGDRGRRKALAAGVLSAVGTVSMSDAAHCNGAFGLCDCGLRPGHGLER
jgi:hypothetical protein